MDLTFSPLTAGQWPALEDLFGRAGASNGCWCMYWRIGPRYRDRPREDNKRDLEQLARSGQPPGPLNATTRLTAIPARPHCLPQSLNQAGTHACCRRLRSRSAIVVWSGGAGMSPPHAFTAHDRRRQKT